MHATCMFGETCMVQKIHVLPDMSITCIYHECHMHVATYMHATCSIHAYNMHVWSNMHAEYCKHACYMHDILTRDAIICDSDSLMSINMSTFCTCHIR